MAFYVNELKKRAKEALDTESNIRNLLDVRLQKRKIMASLMSEIFENGIMPVADKIGYELIVEDQCGDIKSWKGLEDKDEMLRDSLEFSNYPTTQNFSKTFYLVRGKRVLTCYFGLIGNPPDSILRVEFQYKDNFGQPQFIFGFGDIPKSLCETKEWEQFYAKRGLFGPKQIPAESIVEELEKFMIAYDEIPPKILEKLINRRISDR